MTRKHDPHDYETTRGVVVGVLTTFELACEELGICVRCASFELLSEMATAMAERAAGDDDDKALAAYAAQTFGVLGLRILEEVQKHDS